MESIRKLSILTQGTKPDSRRLSRLEILSLTKGIPDGISSIDHSYSAAVRKAVNCVVEDFRSGSKMPEQGFWKRLFRSESLTLGARGALLDFAGSMAVSSINANSPDLVIKGLVAIVIENGETDYRDSLCIVAQLYHSAMKLGMNAVEVFAEVSELGVEGLIKREIYNFPHRSDLDRSLGAFLLRECSGPNGFKYEQIPWSELKGKSDEKN